MASSRTDPERQARESAISWIRDAVNAVCPNAHQIRIIAVGPDGKATIPVPLESVAESLRDRVIEFMQRVAIGEWVRGKTIAAELDEDMTSGHFQRTLSGLVKEGVLESNMRLGYRLVVKQ